MFPVPVLLLRVNVAASASSSHCSPSFFAVSADALSSTFEAGAGISLSVERAGASLNYEGKISSYLSKKNRRIE